MATSLPNYSKIYRFKITLRSKPQIWRCIEIPEKYNFFEFHVAIDDAFDRRNDEWHVFEMIKGDDITCDELIGVFDPSGHIKFSEKEVIISNKFTLINKNCVYIRFNVLLCYVFYNITLEQISTALPNVKYPRCIAGEQINTLESETPGLENRGPAGSNEKVFSLEQITFRDPKEVSETSDSDED